MTDDRQNKICDELQTFPAEQPTGWEGSYPNVGPVAEHLRQLEIRIERLEARTETVPKAAEIQASNTDINTRPGFSDQDIAEIIRAAKS